MSDFIEREAAIKLFNFAVLDCLGMEPTIRAGDIIKALESIPAADVRPVVLCRDCQNSYEWANVDGDNYCYCGYLRSRWNHDNDRMVDDDDFCKWGRKREES